MKLKEYVFTATEEGFEYTFKAYEFPTGQVIVPDAVNADAFYESIDSVTANGLAVVSDVCETGDYVTFTKKQLRDAIRTSIAAYGISAVPESLKHF